MAKKKITLGWREWVSLPDLGIPIVKAKVDTGARTSALHAFELQTRESGDGEVVDFKLHPVQKNIDTVIECTAPVIDRRVVTDSGGHKEERVVIETPIRVGDESWPIEITLTSRDNMLFRMLLGRTAMKGRALVDPGRSYLSGNRPDGD